MEAEFKISVPIVELMRSPSLARLAELVCDAFSSGDTEPESSFDESDGQNIRFDTSVEEMLANVDSMSESEVDELLGKLMNNDDIQSAEV